MASSMPVWWTAIKDLVIPFVAVLVAVVGWYITAQNNKTQSEIAKKKNDADVAIATTNAESAKKKNEADIAIAKTNADSAKRKDDSDVEIAKTNAAMTFLELYDKVPAAEPERRARLVAVSLPILPDRSAFELAVQNLDHDSGAMRSLFTQYGDESWRLLEPYLGRGPYFKTAEFSPDIEYDPMPQRLLEFLDQNNMLSGIEQYLLDEKEHSDLTPVRENVFLNYFRFLRKKQDANRQESVNDGRRKELVAHFLNDTRLLPSTKAYISIAAAICFSNGGGDLRDTSLLTNGVGYFWKGLDVSRGEIPTEDGLRGYFYRHGLYYRDVYGRPVVLPERDELSRSLMHEIVGINEFRSLSWAKVSVMMYSYLAHTPRDTESPFVAFLRPAEGARFMDMIFDWANTAERRRELGQELNSLEGSSILNNLSCGPHPEQCDVHAQRHFAEATIRYYESYYSEDWHPANLLADILDKYPELRATVHRRDYGFSI